MRKSQILNEHAHAGTYHCQEQNSANERRRKRRQRRSLLGEQPACDAEQRNHQKHPKRYGVHIEIAAELSSDHDLDCKKDRARESQKVALPHGKTIECHECDARKTQKRRSQVIARELLAHHRMSDKGHEYAICSRQERALPRRGIDKPYGLQHVRSPKRGTHQKAGDDIRPVEMGANAAEKQGEHDECGDEKTAGKQQIRRQRIEDVFHHAKGKAPHERHGDEHGFPKQR